MKLFFTPIVFGCILLVCTYRVSGQNENPSPFIPEIITEFSNVRDLTISTTENEMYFTVQSPLSELSSIVVVKKSNEGKWGLPEVASFSGKCNDLEPFLSPDGLKLYFVSNRPVEDTSKSTKDFDIWMVGRRDARSAWSIAMNMGPAVNSKDNEFYPAVTKSGNLYFTCDGSLSKGKDDIFICKWNIDNYEAPVSLSDSINSEGYEFNAYVDPDESFIVYTCYNRSGGSGSGDLYISYNLGNGFWSGAKNLGKNINSPQMDYCPFVNPKTETLYFTSKRSNVKPTSFEQLTIADFKKEVNRFDNGWSRLYVVPLKSKN